jgi:hypothetical protein
MNKTDVKEFLIRFDERIKIKAGSDIATKIEKVCIDLKNVYDARVSFSYAFFIKGIFNAKRYDANLKNAIKNVLENMKDVERIKIETLSVEEIGEYSRWVLEISFCIEKKIEKLNKFKFIAGIIK